MADTTLSSLRPWLDVLFAEESDEIVYGLAGLEGLLPESLSAMPGAVSYAVRMNDPLMDSVSNGPTAAYQAECHRVNQLLNDLGDAISVKIRAAGYAAERIYASQTVDRINFTGLFQHKTAAVLAGYGWIGRNCQFITKEFGPRVRLCTVVTDMDLGEQAPPVMRSYCGSCRRCVDACPSGALTGGTWTREGGRAVLFDVATCCGWLNEHYPQYLRICGICTSACPHGTARHKKKAA